MIILDDSSIPFLMEVLQSHSLSSVRTILIVLLSGKKFNYFSK
jgi:hypothetical protein